MAGRVKWPFYILRNNIFLFFKFKFKFKYINFEKKKQIKITHDFWARMLLKQPFKWCSRGKSLGPRGLFSLWSQVRVLWLLIWWSLETYMVVNFRACGISQDTHKLIRTPMLNLKKKMPLKRFVCPCKVCCFSC